MSTLFYGGDPETGAGAIMLVRCEVLDFHREPIYNGPDYLYTRHVLRVRAVYNREINAYDWSPGAPAAAVNATALQQQQVAVAAATKDYVPGLVRLGAASGVGALPAGIAATVARVQRGMDAPTTDAALRHKLLQPRRQLIWLPVAAAGLVSPSINADGTPAACDARNGPTPLSCDVVQVVGGKSYIVDFAIETYVNDATMYRTTPSVLLSHRWNVREEIDQDYYLTYITQGIAHFRTDRLAYLGAVVDDFRASLFHPKLPGYKRMHVIVEPVDDGAALRYTIVDKQLALSIIPSNVTRVECFHTVENTGFQFEAGGREMVGAIKAIMDALGGGGGAGAGVRAAINAATGLINNALNIIPLLKCSVTSRVWGNVDSFRSQLQQAAVSLTLIRMGMSVNPFARTLAGTRLQVTHDVAGTFVECTGSLQTSLAGTSQLLVPGPGFFQNVANLLLGFNTPNMSGFFPFANDDSAPILQSSGPDGTGMQLPANFTAAGTGTRGFAAARLITAALLGQDATPASPSLPGVPVDLSPP